MKKPLPAKYIIGSMQMLLIVIAGYHTITTDWANLFVSLQAVFVSFLPNLLFVYFRIYTPMLLRIGIVLFMFLTLILGEMKGFYDTYVWWDMLLHGIAGIGFTLIGFILLVIFFRQSGRTITAILTSFLAFSFTMAFAVLWEIYEFLIDIFFST